MRRILLGVIAIIVAGAVSAASPAGPSVTVQNTPLPVLITGGTEGIYIWRTVTRPPGQPPGGVPSVVVLDMFLNQSSTTAQIYAYVNSPTNVGYPCGGDPRPTSVDVTIFPIGQPAPTGLQVPMNEHLTVRIAGEDYCWAAMSVGPVFIPPGYKLDFNVVYSTLPEGGAPVRFHVNVNGFYMK